MGDKLSETLITLRMVKLKYAQCCENCFDGDPVDLTQWKVVRGKCLDMCKQPHNNIFSQFYRVNQPVEETRKCVFRCSTELSIRKYGEEDINACQERCYEQLEEVAADAHFSVVEAYKEQYYEHP